MTWRRYEQMIQIGHVRYGSGTDISHYEIYVRFTPNNGHRTVPYFRCPIMQPRQIGLRKRSYMSERSLIDMLIGRNITVDGHRTSIRLEPEFWARLADIAQRENQTIDQLCTEIDRGAGKLLRTAAVRVFIMSYTVRLSQLNTKTNSEGKRVITGDSVAVVEHHR